MFNLFHTRNQTRAIRTHTHNTNGNHLIEFHKSSVVSIASHLSVLHTTTIPNKILVYSYSYSFQLTEYVHYTLRRAGYF